jgi:hypothetical protein
MKKIPTIRCACNLRLTDLLRSSAFDKEPLRDLALLCDRMTAAANRGDDRMILAYMYAIESLARAALNDEGRAQISRATIGVEVDIANSFGARNSTAFFIKFLWEQIQKTNQQN